MSLSKLALPQHNFIGMTYIKEKVIGFCQSIGRVQCQLPPKQFDNITSMNNLSGRQTAAQQQQIRQGTAARLPTGARLTTAMRNDPNFVSVALTTNLKFVDRPVTMQGMAGAKQQGQGPGRQIYERSYYLNLVRTKTMEIYEEIQKFKKQSEDIQKDNTLFISLEKRYDELTKEVRNLEGQLADYNLAFDKQRANTRPEDIRNIYEHIRMQNDRQRAQLDDIFIERKNQEDQIQQIEQHLNELNQMADMKLQELDHDQRQEYQALISENKSLNTEINNQRGLLEEIGGRMQQAENRLRMDNQKLKGQHLKEQINEMESKKSDLELQLNEANLSFPEARDRLLNRIKEDNLFIQNTDKRIKEIRRNIDNYEKKLRELQVEAEDKKSQDQDKQKYEILYQRDKEMTDFINNFEANRRQNLDGMQQLEQKIVEDLEQNSKICNVIRTLPSTVSGAKDVADELNFKTEQTKNSETTLRKLQLEYEARQSDLKKIEQAEERVNTELSGLNEKIGKMQSEISTKFDKVNDVKKEAEQRRNRMTKDLIELKACKDTIQEELNKAQYEHDIKEKKLMMHEHYTNLTDLEKRVSQWESQANSLKTFIASKSKDMNYDSYKQECMTLMDDLNKVLLK